MNEEVKKWEVWLDWGQNWNQLISMTNDRNRVKWHWSEEVQVQTLNIRQTLLQCLLSSYSWQASAYVTSLRSGLSLSPSVRDCLRISGFWISSWLCAPFCPPGPGQAQSTFRKDPVRRQTSQTINVKRDFCKNTQSERYSRDMGAKHSKRRGLSKDDLEYLLGQLFPFPRIV